MYTFLKIVLGQLRLNSTGIWAVNVHDCRPMSLTSRLGDEHGE
jgi:hypothetical protein